MFMLDCWRGGRANGLGGPVAPAESRADADGDGGGRTMPDAFPSGPFGRGVNEALSVAGFRGEMECAVPLPASDTSSGIWTRKRGRVSPPTRRLLDLEGGANVVSGIDTRDDCRVLSDKTASDRLGPGGDEPEALFLARDPTPTDF